MNNHKYTTLENVTFKVKGYNALTKLTNEVLVKVKEVFNEKTIGQKVKAVSTNSLTKQFQKLIDTYQIENGVGYKLFWEDNYLHVKILHPIWLNEGGIRHDFQNEFLVLTVDNEGRCKRILPQHEQKFVTVEDQWQKVQRVAELQQELNKLEYELIRQIR